MTEKVLRQSRWNRLFHWLFAFSIIMLLITGLSTFWFISIGEVTGIRVMVHRSVGFFASGLFCGWVYYHLVTQLYRDVWFRTCEIPGFKGLLKYYFFIQTKLPPYGKYNPGQKLVYTGWFFGFILQFVTGIILFTAGMGNILPFPVLMQKMRFYHFAGALWFLGTIPLHIYLAVTEDPGKLQAMLTGWVRKR